jgi:hypothetical protein
VNAAGFGERPWPSASIAITRKRRANRFASGAIVEESPAKP